MATALPAPGIRGPSARHVAADTDHPGAVWHPSPNFGPRRHGRPPDLIMLHYTAMATPDAALERLCDPEPPGGLGPVSAHYLVCPAGRVWQMVREADRAWHAGAGAWGEVTDVNSHSIGIELANTGAEPFSEPQMSALESLLRDVLDRTGIAPAAVIAHSDSAPGRKVDPGPRFDWLRLARQGLAAWAAPAGAGGNFHDDLAAIGYRLPEGDDPDCLLQSFRLRFRPWGRGPLTEADARMARGLAAAVS